jgi:branched-chain amino acid transport system ATP-binding protein
VSAILRLESVTKRFGGLTAVNNVSFEVARGQIFALIGPNGAGKTTLFNAITGLMPATDGAVLFKGDDISRLRPHQVARRGIARTFQNIRLFPYMTALDNVRVAQHARLRARLWSALFKTPFERAEEARVRERAMELLRFVGIENQADKLARSLPYGLQRRLEVARALATDPSLLLLDEPAAGFTPQEKVELMSLMRSIRDQGMTVFLIEHDMKLVMGAAERIVVLDYGETIAEGTPEEVRFNPRVIEAYLGSE